LRLTENGACGVLRLCGLKVGSRVLVGDAILELVGLGRKLLLLVGRLLVDGLGGVLWLRAVGLWGGSVRVGPVSQGLREGSGAQEGEENQALKIEQSTCLLICYLNVNTGTLYQCLALFNHYTFIVCESLWDYFRLRFLFLYIVKQREQRVRRSVCPSSLVRNG
jgi:hypothetical protein